MKILLKIFQKQNFCDVRYVAMQLTLQVLQSPRKVPNIPGVRIDNVSDSVWPHSVVQTTDMLEKRVRYHNLVVQISIWQPSTRLPCIASSSFPFTHYKAFFLVCFKHPATSAI